MTTTSLSERLLERATGSENWSKRYPDYMTSSKVREEALRDLLLEAATDIERLESQLAGLAKPVPFIGEP